MVVWPSQRGILRAVSLLAIVVAAVIVGCTDSVSGTPRADPAQTGVTETTETTTRTTTRARPGTPETTVDSTGTPPPNGLATTCGEYGSLDESEKLGLINAIGDDGNAALKENPYLWAGLATALCVIVDKSTPVKDALEGMG